MREQGCRPNSSPATVSSPRNWSRPPAGAQFTNGVLMTFGQDPRTLPDGKAVIEKFRASGFEPEGYTLYAYASIQAYRRGLERRRYR